MSETGALWAVERTKAVSSAKFLMLGMFLARPRLWLARRFGSKIVIPLSLLLHRSLTFFWQIKSNFLGKK
jgi:hypothetical protein